MKEYDFYIFDLDNTIVDSRKGYEEAYMAAFEEYGMPYDPALYNEYVRTPLRLTFDRHRPDAPDEYTDFVSAVVKVYRRTCLNGVRLFPDAERCLQRLRERGCVLGIASNSYMGQIDPILERLDAARLFASVVGRDRVAVGKPDPEPVLLCLSEMRARPEDSVMVGDSVNDVYAGKAAGLSAVLIDRCGEGVDCGGECDATIRSMDEL